jgi:hypothetical protein
VDSALGTRITTEENIFTVLGDAMVYVQILFEMGLIWFCANCGEWHITEAGEELELEATLKEFFHRVQDGE